MKETLLILTITNIVLLIAAFIKVMQEGSHIGQAIEEVYLLYKESQTNIFTYFLLIGVLLAAYNAGYAVIACYVIKCTALWIAALILIFWAFGSVLNMIRYRCGGRSFFPTNIKVFILYLSILLNFAYLFYVLTYLLIG